MPTRTSGPSADATAPPAPARDEPEPKAQPDSQPQPRGRRTVEEGGAFDLWLKRSLRDTFDAIAAEPVPEDLLRLIEEDRGERERIRRSRAHGRDP